MDVMNDNKGESFAELAYYTLSHQDMKYFIHQHFVDAWQAQQADGHTRPIALIFSLAGLYLFLEKNFTGRDVQEAHIRMARNKVRWPAITLPSNRGEINIENVLACSPGKDRDEMITRWCTAVWDAYKDEQQTIRILVNTIPGVC
jgi:hypothetical protein